MPESALGVSRDNPTWDEVISEERYKALTPEKKVQLRDGYFETVVAPKVPRLYIDEAKEDFYAYAKSKEPKPPEPSADDDDWELTKGFKMGLHQTKGLGAGTAALVADVFGADDTRDYFIKQYSDAMKEAEKHAPRVTDIIKAKGVVDHIDWALGGFGQLIPTITAMGLGGGFGGLVAKAVVKKIITKEAARLIKMGIKNKITKEATKKILKYTARGQMAGAVAASTTLETGEIYGDVAEKGTTGARAIIVSLLGGSAAGVLDALPPLRVAKKWGLAGGLRKKIVDAMSSKRGVRMLTEGFKVGGYESATEGLQTLIEEVSKAFIEERGLPENVGNQIVNAMALGWLGGHVMGTVGGIPKPGKSALDQLEETPDTTGEDFYDYESDDEGGGLPPETRLAEGDQGQEQYQSDRDLQVEGDTELEYGNRAVPGESALAAQDKSEDGAYYVHGKRFVPIDTEAETDLLSETGIVPGGKKVSESALSRITYETGQQAVPIDRESDLLSDEETGLQYTPPPQKISALGDELQPKTEYYQEQSRALTEQEQAAQEEQQAAQDEMEGVAAEQEQADQEARDQAFQEMDAVAAEAEQVDQQAKDQALDEMEAHATELQEEQIKEAEFQNQSKSALEPKYVAAKLRPKLQDIKKKEKRVLTDRKLAKQNKAFPKNSAMADALKNAGLKKPKGGDQSGGTGGGQPTSPTKPKGRIKSGDSSKHNALEFLRREGGINRNAATSEFVDEAQVKELNKSNIPLFPAEGKGLSIEEIAEKLRDNGYIPDDQNTYDNTLEILRSSLNQGNEHFSQNNTDYINKVYEEKAADEKAKWEARDKTAEAVTKSKERQAKKVAKKDKAENKAEAKAERSALQDTSPGGDASFDFGKNVKAEPIQESTTDSTGQVDVFGVDETAQAIEDKKQETKKKEKNAPDMAKGEGNLFSDISKQTDVEDITKQKVKLQGTNEAGDNITVEMNSDEALSMLAEKKNAYQQLLDCLT